MDRYERDELAAVAISDAVEGAGGWLRAECPFCVLVLGKQDRRRSLAMRRVTGIYKCWRCGTGGVLRRDDVDQYDVEDEVLPPVIEYFDPPDGFVPLAIGAGRSAQSLKVARMYLRKRGVPTDIILDAGVGACLCGKFAQRIVVPIRDSAGRWRGYVGRDWSGSKERKYLYPFGMPRGGLMFSQELLAVRTDEPVMVVEGVFDALQHFDQAVACLGKPSNAHVDILAAALRPVAVCLDGDAWEEGHALAMQLSLRGVRSGYVRIPAGEDPGSVDPAWLKQQAQRCLD